jgi:trimeric autotransporter adhesin
MSLSDLSRRFSRRVLSAGERRRRRASALSAHFRLEALESRLAPAVSTWSGAVGTLWSAAGNWDVPPATGNDLVFPSTAANKTNTDDLAVGTGLGSFSVSGSGYTIGGNAVSLSGPIDASQASGTSTVNLPIVLGNPSVTVDQSAATLVLGGALGGSGGLTKNGPGTLVLPSVNTYTGTTAVSAGILQVDGNEGNSPVTVAAGATLEGTGTAGSIDSTSGTVQPGDAAPGILTDNGGLNIDATSTFSVALNGTTAGSGYSQLGVAGPISLNSATLNVTLGFTPTANEQFTIIHNTGASPATGTFAGLPEGSILTVSEQAFRISYAGGTGKDVVLTHLLPSTVTASALPMASVAGQSVTISASVASAGTSSVLPTGNVQFFSGTSSLGNAALISGVASITTPSLPVGSDSVTAHYVGDSVYNASISPPITLAVSQASTTTKLAVSPNPSSVGVTVTLTATIAPVSPSGGSPTGTVDFFNGTTSLGSGTLSNGVGILTTTALPLGVNSLTAKYEGDASFKTSTSTAVSDTVNAATSTTLTASKTSIIFGQPVTFTATVTSTTPGAGTPTGAVNFVNGTTIVGTGNLTNGVATLTTSALPIGANAVTAVYSGGTGFSPSTSTAATVTVTQESTTTTLTSSPNPSAVGQTVTLTATVAAVPPGGGTPSGTVEFDVGGTAIGTGTLVNGVATFTSTTLVLGSSAITAKYAGNANSAASTSAPIIQQVLQGSTTTTVTSSKNNPVAFEAVTLTATVVAATGSGTPTGTVEFLVNGLSVGTGMLASGKATLVTKDFPLGSDTVIAVYQGDSNFTASTSAGLAIQAGAPTEQFINQIYLDVLGRPAGEQELDYWRTQLFIGRPIKTIVREIVDSGDAAINSVQTTYQFFLGRDATSREVDAALSPPNSSYATVYASVLGSSEYFTTVGGGTDKGFLTAVYQDVIGTAIPSDTLAALTTDLQQGESRYDLSLSLVTSEKGRANEVQNLFNAILGRDANAKEVRIFVDQLDHGAGRRTLIIELLSSKEFVAKYPSV